MILSEAAANLHRAAIGLLKRREIDRIAAKHRPKLTAFFRKQRDLTLEKFKAYDFLFTESHRALREEVHPNELLTTHDWDRLWTEIDRDTFDDLQRVIAGVESEGVLKGGNQLLKQLQPGGATPTSVMWTLSNPRAVAWFQEKGGSLQYIKGIQETTRNQLQTIIGNAIESGQGYQKTAKEISDTFDDMSRDRAKRIAVFESGQAYEAGNQAFAASLQDDGLTMEEHWMTSHDEKVRPEHAANEAEGWVPMGHTYSSGDTDPPTDPGCRCYKIYRAAKS
jgi:SPP1 gp7 family putative phage head morphogenesis protein